MDKAKYLKIFSKVRPDPKKDTAHLWMIDAGIIAADRYAKGALVERYIIDLQTGEHHAYFFPNKKWSICKFESVFSKSQYSYWSYYCLDKLKKDYKVIVDKQIPGRKNGYSDIIREIDHQENSYNSQKRSDAEARRRGRIADIMGKVPSLPEDFEEWYFRVSGLDNLNYLIYDEENEKFRCTKCGKKIVGSGIKNHKVTTCPNCGAEVRARKNRNQLEITVKGSAAILQRIDEENVVARYMDICAVYDKNGRSIRYSESERMVYTTQLKKDGFIQHSKRLYYAQFESNFYSTCSEDVVGNEIEEYIHGGKGEFDWKSNPYQRRTRSGYLYPGNIKEILNGTEIQNKAYMLQAIADRGICVNTARMISCTASDEARQTVEFAAKLGYQRLIREAFESRTYGYDLMEPDRYGSDHSTVTKIKDLPKQERNRLRDLDGGLITYNLLWYVVKHGQGMKVSDDALKWFEEEVLDPGTIWGYDMDISPDVIMHYLIRQKKESYPRLTYRAVFEEWIDYLSMAVNMNKNMDDEMVFKPAKLKLRHDQLVEEKRQREAIQRAKENKELAKKREKELKGRYPKAQAALSKIRKKYEYGNDDFVIIVPKTLYDIVQEGYMLHHCVGSSDRYFERMERAETYICFLRRASAPEAPYYTIEIEPGGTIRQHRSFYDEEPGIEEIRDFLREWQKVIKKRLTAADKKAAEESKRLGELNLEELLRTKGKNDRVYKALLEDYLEAI